MTQWLTLEELGLYLKVSRAYLYKTAQAGQIPAVKVGRSWRFDREKIDFWLHQRESPGRPPSTDFPWSDCLQDFLTRLHKEFGKRFGSLWIYGSWARGEATSESDVDILVVLESITNFREDFKNATSLAYQSTYGRNRSVLFSAMITDQKTFQDSEAPILSRIRKEGKKLF